MTKEKHHRCHHTLQSSARFQDLAVPPAFLSLSSDTVVFGYTSNYKSITFFFHIYFNYCYFLITFFILKLNVNDLEQG